MEFPDFSLTLKIHFCPDCGNPENQLQCVIPGRNTFNSFNLEFETALLIHSLVAFQCAHSTNRLNYVNITIHLLIQL